jgi:tRNA (guanine37-N1)-methyltransferase
VTIGAANEVPKLRSTRSFAGIPITSDPGAAISTSVRPQFEKLSPRRGRVILLTPQGRRFDQARARELAREQRLILIAGRYEGFDERIRIGLGAEQISIGDYVLNGGELPAMVVIDAVVRLLPGALGDEDSARDDSFSDGLLEYPHYTRPEIFRDMKVPDVLLSGDHARIAEWRRRPARERTRRHRPDLLDDTDPAG